MLNGLALLVLLVAIIWAGAHVALSAKEKQKPNHHKK
ncbi:hypothetical protein EP10_002151 [Geobacillus icigianus]|uniref:MetS family NSS transporter small subunit n=1 Tax=Geobacillus icigianus TaxID=1430331 RepID=A0ABU6BH41_9BACL|nr:hypothetical protein [Geobacillus icigianus]